ncbi:unnamed protein product [Cunninghamella echinulata]
MLKGSILFASTLLLGTAVFAQNQNPQDCVSNYNPSTDYFPQKFKSNEDSADLFTIEYHNNYKLLTNVSSNATFALVQCGTPAPANSSLPANTEVYEIPIKSAAVLSTTVVPYLEALGVAETVKVVSGSDFIASSCFQKYLSNTNNNVVELSATNTTLSNQQLQTAKAQFGFTAGGSDPIPSTSVDGSESFEKSALGRTSWLGYYAAFYNVEDVANNALQSITNNYNNLKKAASSYSTKPVVAWALYDAPSQFNKNTGTYQIKTGGYRQQLTEDAGATIFNSTTLKYSTSQEFLNAIKDVNILIDETYIATNLTDVLKNYQISDVNQYKFAKAIYRQDGILTASGGYDWFSTPFVMADALLEDIINVVNPSAPSAEYKRHWLRNVANNEPVHTAKVEECNWDETQPRPSLATNFNGNPFTLSNTSAASSLTVGMMTVFASLMVSFFLA